MPDSQIANEIKEMMKMINKEREALEQLIVEIESDRDGIGLMKTGSCPVSEESPG